MFFDFEKESKNKTSFMCMYLDKYNSISVCHFLLKKYYNFIVLLDLSIFFTMIILQTLKIIQVFTHNPVI
jgi:hypothetical protein